MALSDLADEIAGWEAGTETEEVPRSAVERVHVSLYHAHVPKLADAGIVNYDRDRDVVALSADGERLERFLEGVIG